MIPYFKPKMHPTCNYLFWIDSPSNTYKKVIRYAPSFDIALSQYIRDLPSHVSAKYVNTIKHKKLEKGEEILT